MSSAIERAFQIVREMAENPAEYAADAIFIAPDHVASVFSAERARLYNVLREEGPFDSVRALAEAVGRDVTRVSRDLAVMEGCGLVHLERSSGAKAKQVRADPRPVLVV